MTELQIATGIIGALMGVCATLIAVFVSLGGSRFSTAVATVNGANGQNRKLDKLLTEVTHNREVVMEGQREVVASNTELRVVMERVATILEQRLPHG